MEKFNDKDNKITDELLVRYACGECLLSEKEEVESWINFSSENSKLYERVNFIVQSTRILQKINKIDTQKALQKVKEQIPELNRKKRISWITILQRAAALLFIPLLGFLWYTLNTLHNDNETIVYNEVKSTPGMISKCTLPDGSLVWLNSGSTLKYPSKFQTNSRNVELKGEAFFEVEHNSAKPFYVKANSGITIKVTGTRFNLNAYPDDNTVETTLVNGKILLEQQVDANTIKETPITPGTRASFSKETGKLMLESVNTDYDIAWKNGKIIFKNSAIEDVIKTLERKYNIDIELKGSKLQSYRYTATFTDETLIQVLDLLKLSAPLNYRILKQKQQEDSTFTRKKVIIYTNN
jgi:ferric-dicitrate binding protein FerR (iron transport regulator)